MRWLLLKFAVVANAQEFRPGVLETFYKDVKTNFMGIMNERSIYFVVDNKVLEGNRYAKHGRAREVKNLNVANITAFHVCPHRFSLIYEIKNSTVLHIMEYFVGAQTSTEIYRATNDEASSALICLENKVLRATPSELQLIDIGGRASKSYPLDRDNPITSMTVAFPGNAFFESSVVAVLGGELFNITYTSDKRMSKQKLLPSGPTMIDGKDAVVVNPKFVAWTHESTTSKLLFIDGCTLRVMEWGGDYKVHTVLDTICPGLEKISPLPWASRLGKITGLSAQEDTNHPFVVLSTTDAMYSVTPLPATHCDGMPEKICVTQKDCGLAKRKNGMQYCFSCSQMKELSSKVSGNRWKDVCPLEFPAACSVYNGDRKSCESMPMCNCDADCAVCHYISMQDNVEYHLEGCDCSAGMGLSYTLGIFVVIVALGGGAAYYMYKQKQIQMQFGSQLLQRECFQSEFNVFADHYDPPAYQEIDAAHYVAEYQEMPSEEDATRLDGVSHYQPE